jgi:hypothetical protein
MRVCAITALLTILERDEANRYENATKQWIKGVKHGSGACSGERPPQIHDEIVEPGNRCGRVQPIEPMDIGKPIKEQCRLDFRLEHLQARFKQSALRLGALQFGIARGHEHLRFALPGGAERGKEQSCQ